MPVQSPPKLLILIQEDPFVSHRAVEALRIALGLGSSNEGKDLTIVLTGRAPHLLADDITDIIDGEILEKHLPVFIEWETPFYISMDADTPAGFNPDCIVKKIAPADI